MATKKMIDALNDQLNFEAYSGYIYLAMAAQCEQEGRKGAANWLFCQMQEEQTHSLRFWKYVNSLGEHVELKQIDGPQTRFESLMNMFEIALEHEKKVTARINRLVGLAREENDYATENFLQWFVKEQIEEEENVNEVIDELKLAGDDGRALLLVDKDLATRVFTMPPDLAGGAG